ncbi:MAG TPA: TrmH family RNA methyltransferase, partial [Candidatus Norongarragalinales archaeon]|nr:TrmH family RNA methyltransferase [Candidatus Norongarragalinales archaeon]
MNNFGFSELAFVGRNKVNFTSRMFAKHSERILERAKIHSTLSEAVQGCDFVVGTTGVLDRFRKSLKTCISLERLPEKLKGLHAALVFGSEDKGLSEMEVSQCDVLVHIPSSPSMPILNLSHAVAVTLYELRQKRGFVDHRFHPASLNTRRILEEKFQRLMAASDRVKNKRKVSLAFRKLLARSLPSQDEAQALMAGLAGLESELEKR